MSANGGTLERLASLLSAIRCEARSDAAYELLLDAGAMVERAKMERDELLRQLQWNQRRAAERAAGG
jgi:hypothetical protein